MRYVHKNNFKSHLIVEQKKMVIWEWGTKAVLITTGWWATLPIIRYHQKLLAQVILCLELDQAFGSGAESKQEQNCYYGKTSLQNYGQMGGWVLGTLSRWFGCIPLRSQKNQTDKVRMEQSVPSFFLYGLGVSEILLGKCTWYCSGISCASTMNVLAP